MREALIVGGGIGGLFSAICLSLTGWKVRVLEQAPALQEIGAGIQVSPNGTRLLQDTGIIRHRGKIEAVINNAARAQELVAEAGSLAAFFWSFEPKLEDLPEPQTASTSP